MNHLYLSTEYPSINDREKTTLKIRDYQRTINCSLEKAVVRSNHKTYTTIYSWFPEGYSARRDVPICFHEYENAIEQIFILVEEKVRDNPIFFNGLIPKNIVSEDYYETIQNKRLVIQEYYILKGTELRLIETELY